MEFDATLEICIYESLGKGKTKMSLMFECEGSEEQVKEILEAFHEQRKDFKSETVYGTNGRFKDEMKFNIVGGQFFPAKSRLRIKLI